MKLNAAIVETLADKPTRAAVCRSRTGNSAARAADAGSAVRSPEGGDREVVAAHQGRRPQGRLKEQRNEGILPRAPDIRATVAHFDRRQTRKGTHGTDTDPPRRHRQRRARQIESGMGRTCARHARGAAARRERAEGQRPRPHRLLGVARDAGAARRRRGRGHVERRVSVSGRRRSPARRALAREDRRSRRRTSPTRRRSRTAAPGTAAAATTTTARTCTRPSRSTTGSCSPASA